MKIAISTDNGRVAAHFGRCRSYTIVEIENGQVAGRSEIDNPGHETGFLPGFLSEKGVQAIIAGGMGERARGLFAAKNIQTVTGVQGTIDEVIEKYLQTELESGLDMCDRGGECSETGHHENSVPAADAGFDPAGRICVSADGPTLDSRVDPNFGRAAYFIIADPESLEFQALANPHTSSGHGAGIQAAEFVAGRSVTAVLAAQVGPNARAVLESAGIRILRAEKGTVREVLSRLKKK